MHLTFAVRIALSCMLSGSVELRKHRYLHLFVVGHCSKWERRTEEEIRCQKDRSADGGPTRLRGAARQPAWPSMTAAAAITTLPVGYRRGCNDLAIDELQLYNAACKQPTRISVSHLHLVLGLDAVAIEDKLMRQFLSFRSMALIWTAYNLLFVLRSFLKYLM